MFKIIKIPKKLIQAVNKDILICLSKLFDKKVLNQDDIFIFLRKNPDVRPQVFDILNMLPILSYINFHIKEIIEKNISKNFLINWTYPQIRLDDRLSKKFSAPAHKDRWIIDKDKKGYIAWIPLKKSGSSLLIANKENTKKNILNSYLRAVDDVYWYDKKVFELIAKGKSVAKLSRDTKIGYYSLYNTYNKVKNKLKDELL